MQLLIGLIGLFVLIAFSLLTPSPSRQAKLISTLRAKRNLNSALHAK